MKRAALLFACLAACAGSAKELSTDGLYGELLRVRSVGLVGCLEFEMKVSELKEFYGTHRWRVECRGRRFLCSNHPNGNAACTRDE